MVRSSSLLVVVVVVVAIHQCDDRQQYCLRLATCIQRRLGIHSRKGKVLDTH